jgi:FKBP-type peptidyl-prolyl cis-trans isomerase
MRTLSTAFLAAGLLLAAAPHSFAQDGKPEAKPAAEPSKQPADAAKQPAADDAKKAEMEKAIRDAIAKAGATGQPPAAAPSPNAVPVPDGLPVIKKIELEDGLIAEELKIGDGYEVKPGGAVVAHYHGTLKEGGKVFDSSFQRGDPAMFPLNQVIPGWQKGVPGMKIGGIRRLLIPAKLGYGERGAGQDIPPNADLVFIIQLVDALQVTDDKIGDGEEVGSQPVCVTAYTMKDADGKEIGSATKDKPYIWIPNEMMGVSVGLEGMKVGGKRTIKVPAKMNQTDPRIAGSRPQQIPITVQVELLAVRNLAPATPKK